MGCQRSSREGKYFFPCLACCIIMMWGLVSCIPPALQQQGGQELSKMEFKVGQDEYEASTLLTLNEAKSKMVKGEYEASVQETLRVLEKDPMVHKDQALFQLGLLYAHPKNPNMDYEKSMQYFERLLGEFPLSEKSEEARIWILTIRGREEEWQEIRKKLSILEKAAEAKEKKVQNLREEIEERDKKLNEMENELGQTKDRVTELEAQMSKFKDVDLTIEEKKRPTSPRVPKP
jgi:tetratricopeptide (TPR) repeat protein